MKQTRLLEIIREEISSALGAETTNIFTGRTLEEDTLNEMAFALVKGLDPSEKIEPRYKKENFKKVVDLILSKVDGKKTTSDIAKELGIIQQKINPIVSDLIIAGILEKGEAESKAGKNIDNKPGPKAKSEKSEPKTKSEPKAKTTTLTKGDDGLDSVDSSDADNDKEATQNIGKDKTAKKLGKVAYSKNLTPEEEIQYKTALKSINAKVKRIEDGEEKPDDRTLLKKTYQNSEIQRLFKAKGSNLNDILKGIIG